MVETDCGSKLMLADPEESAAWIAEESDATRAWKERSSVWQERSLTSALISSRRTCERSSGSSASGAASSFAFFLPLPPDYSSNDDSNDDNNDDSNNDSRKYRCSGSVSVARSGVCVCVCV